MRIQRSLVVKNKKGREVNEMSTEAQASPIVINDDELDPDHSSSSSHNAYYAFSSSSTDDQDDATSPFTPPDADHRRGKFSSLATVTCRLTHSPANADGRLLPGSSSAAAACPTAVTDCLRRLRLGDIVDRVPLKQKVSATSHHTSMTNDLFKGKRKPAGEDSKSNSLGLAKKVKTKDCEPCSSGSDNEAMSPSESGSSSDSHRKMKIDNFVKQTRGLTVEEDVRKSFKAMNLRKRIF